MKVVNKGVLWVMSIVCISAQACHVSYKTNPSETQSRHTEVHREIQYETSVKMKPRSGVQVDTTRNGLDSISWNETIHKFPDGVASGPPATFTFVFTNHGNKPIKIKNVEAACSCTASEYSRQEIPPGSSGWVKASYKTENTFGFFNKYIEVEFEGIQKVHRLYVTGTVDPYNKGSK